MLGSSWMLNHHGAAGELPVSSSLASAKGGEEDFHGQTLAGTNVLYTESWQEGSQEHTDFGYMPCLGDDYQGSS